MNRSKNYKEKSKLVDKGKEYKLEEALELIPKVSTDNFDASIEIHINLNIMEKQRQGPIKGSTTLPHQFGNEVKLAVVTTPEHFEEAKEVENVGEDKLINKISDGFDDFDILIATPEVMPKLAKLGKILGPQGKMPNPKNGTVTTDLKKTIKSFKEGKINFRSDDGDSIHQVVGKVSMKKENISENIHNLVEAVLAEMQNKFKVTPFKSIYVTPTMGPSIKLDPKEFIN